MGIVRSENVFIMFTAVYSMSVTEQEPRIKGLTDRLNEWMNEWGPGLSPAHSLWHTQLRHIALHCMLSDNKPMILSNLLIL